jgi:hypothetical protein
LGFALPPAFGLPQGALKARASHQTFCPSAFL